MCFIEKKLYTIHPHWCSVKLENVYATYLVLTKEMAQNGIYGRSNQNQPLKKALARTGWIGAGNSLKT